MKEENTTVKLDTAVKFATPGREWLRIVPSENGWDVVIPEDVTLTQAAQMFIQAVNELKSKMQPTVEKKEWSGE